MKNKNNIDKELMRALFIQLLNEDGVIHQAIRGIFSHDGHQNSQSMPIKIPKQPQELSLPHDSLLQALSHDLELLKRVTDDPELCEFLLGRSPDSEGQRLRKLLAVAAQWERVLPLWDFLAERCKQTQQSATAAERQILAGCLEIHNLIWSDSKALLFSTENATRYDYQLHERGTVTGDQIVEEWLPGLKNPGGKVQKKPLVKTQ